MNVVKCERFVRAMQKRELSAAFVSWEAEWRRLKSQRRALNKCVTRMTKRTVFSAFSAWASTTAELRRQRAIVKRAAAKIARNALATTFYDWQRKWRGKAEWEAKVALSGRFLAAIKSQTLSSAFAGWRDTHRKLRTDEVKVARCIQRMTQNVVARAFIDWAEKVEAKRKADEQAERDRCQVGGEASAHGAFHLGVEESVAERRVRAVVGKHAGADGGAQGRAADGEPHDEPSDVRGVQRVGVDRYGDAAAARRRSPMRGTILAPHLGDGVFPVALRCHREEQIGDPRGGGVARERRQVRAVRESDAEARAQRGVRVVGRRSGVDSSPSGGR